MHSVGRGSLLLYGVPVSLTLPRTRHGVSSAMCIAYYVATVEAKHAVPLPPPAHHTIRTYICVFLRGNLRPIPSLPPSPSPRRMAADGWPR